MDFGWWLRDPEAGKFQVWVVFHGGEVTWRRKQGHHEPWEPLEPVTVEMWDRLMDEAAKRVPRRLMSPKQFDELKRVRAAAEDAGTPSPEARGAFKAGPRSPSADRGGMSRRGFTASGSALDSRCAGERREY